MTRYIVTIDAAMVVDTTSHEDAERQVASAIAAVFTYPVRKDGLLVDRCEITAHEEGGS